MKLGEGSWKEGTRHGSRRALERRSIASGSRRYRGKLVVLWVPRLLKQLEIIGQFQAWLAWLASCAAFQFSSVQFNSTQQYITCRNPADTQLTPTQPLCNETLQTG